MSNVPAHLPGDLGEHDPRREAHPIGNEPGSGGHEVKIGSNEAKGLNSDATAAEHSNNRNPASDNTAEHAFNGGSVENMDRQKRQQASDIPGGRTGHDGVSDHLTRAGLEQQGNNREYNNSGLTGNHGSGLTGSSHTGSGLTGSHTGSHTGTGLVAEGERALHSGNHSHQHGSTGSGLTGSTGYGSDNLQSSGFTGSDPQERHQLHHGTAHHSHDFSHSHNTRTGELLDPASGRDTGIPGYAGDASGLTGSSHTGTGLTGSSHTGSGLTGSSHTGTGLTGSSHTGSTGSGLVAEGERALHSGSHGTHGQTGYGETGYGQTGSGLTGSNTGYGQTGSGLTGSSTGYGQTGSGLTGSSHTGTGLTGSSHTGSTGSGLVAEGERALHGNHGQTGYGQTGSGLTGSSHTGAGLTGSTGSGLTGSNTGSGLTGSNTGYGQTGTTTGSGLTGSHTGSTGERLREDVREGEHATSHTGATEHKKPSLLDKLNPMKDSDGDGKKGFMK